jgi:hypothetical protein
MAKKSVDPLKAKAKKQKIILAVLGVLFIGLLAFQVPRVMKQLNPPAPVARTPAGSTPPAGTPTLAAPTLRGAEDPSGSTAGGTDSLASAAASTLQDGQLSSFSRFASKDPFSQQLGEKPSTAPSSAGSSSSGGTSGPGIPAVPGNSPAPGSAVISVNGTLYTVAKGTNFPQPTATDSTLVPLFHLVSLTAHTATISIAGGSYATGARTVTLKESKAVTLMNTADGTRYTLTLKPPGTAMAASSTGTGTSSGSSTSEGTSPTSTTVTLPPPTP